jgi:hypothetical protein
MGRTLREPTPEEVEEALSEVAFSPNCGADGCLPEKPCIGCRREEILAAEILRLRRPEPPRREADDARRMQDLHDSACGCSDMRRTPLCMSAYKFIASLTPAKGKE